MNIATVDITPITDEIQGVGLELLFVIPLVYVAGIAILALMVYANRTWGFFKSLADDQE